MFLTNFKTGHRHRTANNWLTILVLGGALYLIGQPLVPHFQLWNSQRVDTTQGVVYAGDLAEIEDVGTSALKQAPDGYRLVLPSLYFDQEIFVSDDPAAVDQGVWHRPNTSTPDKGGNTVLVGHRFAFSKPSTFFHLDKVRYGDRFSIWWDGQEYVYEVFNVEVVEATAIEIEESTEKPIATLYTCTPIWTAKDRLVVQAELIEFNHENI